MGWSLPRWLRIRLFDEDGIKYSTTNRLPVDAELTNADGGAVNIQHPIPTNGDSVYCKDIWVDESDLTDWEDADSTGDDLAYIPFNNLHSHITNSTTDNPKTILIHFNRTVSGHQVGLGCFDVTDAFSNVKIELLGSGGQVRTTVDDSSNNTKYNSRNYEFEPQLFNAIRLEFYTADSICLSNITIQKGIYTNSFIQIQKPDNTIVNAQGTTQGNFKISLDELDDAVKGQKLQSEALVTTPAIEFYDEMSRITKSIEAEHAAIHDGFHFNYADYQLDNASGSTITFTFTTPSNGFFAHFLFMACSSLGATLEIYEGATGITGGTEIIPRNNNRNSSITSLMTLLKDPTITNLGTRGQGFLLGGDRQSGQINRDNEYVLKSNTSYALVITSLVNSCNIGWDAEWYEYVSYTNA